MGEPEVVVGIIWVLGGLALVKFILPRFFGIKPNLLEVASIVVLWPFILGSVLVGAFAIWMLSMMTGNT